MKKIQLLLASLIFAAFFVSVSCKKDNVANVKLTYADTAHVVAVQKGTVIYISLGLGNNPAYKFGDWQYDVSVLQLVAHEHVDPPDPKIIGGTGITTWTFKTLATGTTSLKLTNAGFHATNVPLFSNTIKVN